MYWFYFIGIYFDVLGIILICFFVFFLLFLLFIIKISLEYYWFCCLVIYVIMIYILLNILSIFIYKNNNIKYICMLVFVLFCKLK